MVYSWSVSSFIKEWDGEGVDFLRWICGWDWAGGGGVGVEDEVGVKVDLFTGVVVVCCVVKEEGDGDWICWYAVVVMGVIVGVMVDRLIGCNVGDFSWLVVGIADVRTNLFFAVVVEEEEEEVGLLLLDELFLVKGKFDLRVIGMDDAAAAAAVVVTLLLFVGEGGWIMILFNPMKMPVLGAQWK